MKKIILYLTAIFLLLVKMANAQSNSLVQQSEMKREKFRLAIVESNGLDNKFKQTALKKYQLQLLFSEKQFSTYNHARSCYHASIPLLSLAACGVAGTGLFLGVNIHDIIHHPNRYQDRDGDPIALRFAFAWSCFAVTSLFLIPGLTLIIYSAKKLNRIVENYNTQHYSSFYQSNIQINFGFTTNGIGMKLTF
jgi:hypothetical protein